MAWRLRVTISLYVRCLFIYIQYGYLRKLTALTCCFRRNVWLFFLCYKWHFNFNVNLFICLVYVLTPWLFNSTSWNYLCTFSVVTPVLVPLTKRKGFLTTRGAYNWQIQDLRLACRRISSMYTNQPQTFIARYRIS